MGKSWILIVSHMVTIGSQLDILYPMETPCECGLVLYPTLRLLMSLLDTIWDPVGSLGEEVRQRSIISTANF